MKPVAYLICVAVFATYFAIVGLVAFRDPAYIFTSFWVFASDLNDPWAWFAWCIIVFGTIGCYSRARGWIK